MDKSFKREKKNCTNEMENDRKVEHHRMEKQETNENKSK